MPHILFKGKFNFDKVKSSFSKQTQTIDGWILKYNNLFASTDEKQILIETASIRSGFIQTYFVMVEQKQDKVTVRVCPLTNVEKTDGVKRSIGYIGSFVYNISPDISFDKSNLETEFLPVFTRE